MRTGKKSYDIFLLAGDFIFLAYSHLPLLSSPSSASSSSTEAKIHNWLLAWFNAFKVNVCNFNEFNSLLRLLAFSLGLFSVWAHIDIFKCTCTELNFRLNVSQLSKLTIFMLFLVMIDCNCTLKKLNWPSLTWPISPWTFYWAVGLQPWFIVQCPFFIFHITCLLLCSAFLSVHCFVVCVTFFNNVYSHPLFLRHFRALFTKNHIISGLLNGNQIEKRKHSDLLI